MVKYFQKYVESKGGLPKFKTSFLKTWMRRGKTKSQAKSMFQTLYGGLL